MKDCYQSSTPYTVMHCNKKHPIPPDDGKAGSARSATLALSDTSRYVNYIFQTSVDMLLIFRPCMRSISSDEPKFSTFVQIQHDAYMLTRSMQAPLIRAPTRLGEKPWASNVFIYQRTSAEERRITRSPIFRLRFNLVL